MEIFSNSSYFITNLITKFQNNEIDKSNFNKKILLNTIFLHSYFKNKNKKYKKIKEQQSSTFQSFFKLEYMQEQSEKQLISKIRDRKSKKIIEESIKKERQNLLNDLAAQKDIKIFAEHTFNTYVPMKNISLSLNFQINKNIYNSNKKYIPKSDLKIQHMNPNLNEKENRIVIDNFIESPFYQDFDFDLDKSVGNEDNKNEFININEIDGYDNKDINENDEFLNMIENEDDETLFYDEKFEKNEKKIEFEGWIKKYKKDDMITDFQDFKHRTKNIIGKVNDIYLSLKQDENLKKDLQEYLKNSENIYKQITKQEHFHEFTGYLNEKTYKIYIKKMNYSYLIFMLLNFFDFERFATGYLEYIEEKNILLIFLKKMLLSAGLSSSKVFESVVHIASTKKGQLNFEDYLSCFLPIFELSDRFQYFKYAILLFLLKKSGENIITLSNYRVFCNIIRGKLVYRADTSDDIIAKLLPILKAKYPKDDTENLNYQHVTIILEFLVNYEYGE